LIATAWLIAAIAREKIEKTSGHKNLDKAAIKAISACKFKPGMKDGAVAQTWTKVEYVWSL
jgi:protein TonB